MSESDTMFNKRDRRCAAVQLMLFTNPSYDNRTIASTLKMQIRMVQLLRAQLNASDDLLEVVEQKPKAEDTTRKTWTKEFIKKVQAIIDGTPQWCGVVIPWCNQVAGGSRTRCWPTSPKRPNLGFRRSATTLYPSLTAPPFPQPEPAGLLHLVIRREHQQHDLAQHQSQPDRLHLPSIHQALADACGKGMLPVPDPYRGGD